MLRIVSAALEDALRRRYSPVHVAARLAQLDEVAGACRARRGRRCAPAWPRSRRRWPGGCGCRRRWRGAGSAHRRAHAGGARRRCCSGCGDARAGFAALPVDDRLPRRPPEPVAMRRLSMPRMTARGPRRALRPPRRAAARAVAAGPGQQRGRTRAAAGRLRRLARRAGARRAADRRRRLRRRRRAARRCARRSPRARPAGAVPRRAGAGRAGAAHAAVAPGPHRRPPAARSHARAAIERVADDVPRRMAARRPRGWDEELALLHGLGDLAALRWDELRGQLRSREWREAQRLAALLRSCRALAELIRRARPQRAPSRAAAAHRRRAPRPPMRRCRCVRRETRLPDAPGEITGIRFSGRLERMLASEAVHAAPPGAAQAVARAPGREPAARPTRARRCWSTGVPDPQGRARGRAAPPRRERAASAGRSSCASTPRARCAARRRTSPRRW